MGMCRTKRKSGTQNEMNGRLDGVRGVTDDYLSVGTTFNVTFYMFENVCT